MLSINATCLLVGMSPPPCLKNALRYIYACHGTFTVEVKVNVCIPTAMHHNYNIDDKEINTENEAIKWIVFISLNTCGRTKEEKRKKNCFDDNPKQRTNLMHNVLNVCKNRTPQNINNIFFSVFSQTFYSFFHPIFHIHFSLMHVP